MVQSVARTVEVDPYRGVDQPSGRPHLPYKTLTAALVAAQGNAIIRLAPGTYSTTTGERFPLIIEAGVIVLGQENTQGDGVILTGGGGVPGEATISATVVLADQGQLRGLTVQNPQGIGVVVRGGSPLVRACRFSQCAQGGMQVAGAAIPLVLNSRFEANAGFGLAFTDQAKGEVRQCSLQRCNIGIHLWGAAAPLLVDNQCSNNQTGLRVAGNASPVLRQNRLVQNQQWGLLVQEQGRPDLGQTEEDGRNILRYNGQGDMRNDTGSTLVLVGNDVLIHRLVGPLTLSPSRLPDLAAVPAMLLDQPISAPPPVEPGPPTPRPPAPVISRFSDLQGHWAAAYIEALANRNLVAGFADGTYRPDDIITRAQFAALVAASYGAMPFVRGSIAFVDVPQSFWGYTAIDLAQRRGFVSGYPDQTYRPAQPMTRVHAWVAVANGLGLPVAPASVLGVYGDRAQIPSYATNALTAATQAGLIVNHPNPTQLRPQEPMTRAEVGVLIYQGLITLGQATPLANSTSTAIAPQTTLGSFPDIQSHWAADFIQGLLNLNLVQGQADGRFQPDAPLSRAEFALLLNQAFRPTPRRAARRFADVPPSHAAYAAIQSAYQGQFLAGFPDGTFAPDHPILRLQVWLALVNGLGLLSSAAEDTTPLASFRDRQTLPAYALEAVAAALRLGLVINVPDRDQLSPHRVASRADAAAAVYQALVYQNRLPPISHPALVRPLAPGIQAI